ncbi:hypothetical protein C8J56DRAFT_862229 [Mycena floridula]|nr:hypothetical protein C8J56DRAFT_862229 [Mycena floridula]
MRMKEKGIYTEKFRALARLLVQNGCSANKVGLMIRAVTKSLGLQMSSKFTMSSRTVRRAILEGGIAGKLQLAFEISHTPAFTASGDSTSNRKINFESRHLKYRVPDYSTPNNLFGDIRNSIPRTRFLALEATPDHSSETSKAGWVQNFEELVKLYAESPLGKRENQTKKLDLLTFAQGLRAMNGDHANNEKKTASLMEEWKTEITIDALGTESLAKQTGDAVTALIQEWNFKKVDDAGGFEAWVQLSSEERAVIDTATVAAIVESLGKAAFEALPAPERRSLSLFLWSGCCMHKEQNSFKGGYQAMMAAWKKRGVKGPMILANKWNAQAVKNALSPEKGGQAVTPEETAALENSTFGGAKLCAPAGTIFNNKDDKKGQGDSHVIHLAGTRFPDTSNARFASYGEAADELIAELKRYREYMLHIRDAKQSGRFTNIEQNVCDALCDPETLAELVVMSLFSQNVTLPYLTYVRSTGLNGLTLGPWHKFVDEYLEMVIKEPGQWLDASNDAAQCTLDGQPWKRPEAIVAARELAPTLPLVQEMIVEFAQGMKGTFIRFASEYAPGGLIDGATSEELDLAWVDPTNDVNEGLLGTYRVDARKNPTKTLHQFNHLTIWARNETQAFMDTMLTQSDQQHIRKLARELDKSGLEKIWRARQKEADEKVVAIRRAKVDASAAKKQAEFA